MEKAPKVTDWRRNQNRIPRTVFVVQPKAMVGLSGPPTDENKFNEIYHSVCWLQDLEHVGNLQTGEKHYQDPLPRSFAGCGGAITVDLKISPRDRNRISEQVETIIRCGKCGSIMASIFLRGDFLDLMADLMFKQMFPHAKRLMFMDCSFSEDPMIKRLGVLSVASRLFTGISFLTYAPIARREIFESYSLGFMIASSVLSRTEDRGLPWAQYLFRRYEERIEEEINKRTKRVILGYGQDF